MSYPNVVVNGDELNDEEILQLSSANFSLRVALIFLIVTVLIFGIMQLIKLIVQIRIIRNTVDKANIPFDSKTPKIMVYQKDRKSSKKSDRKRKSKHSRPSKEMKIQLSLTNEQGKCTFSDSEILLKKKEKNNGSLHKKEAQSMTETNTLPYDKVQNFSEEISMREIKNSLASSDKNSSVPVRDLQHQPAPSSKLAKQKPAFSAIKAQDSLMVINNQMPLQPVSNVKQRNLDTESKEQKATFSRAKPQDSLMIINNQMPLQPANSVEKQSMEMVLSNSEESKSVKGKGSENVKL